jgi:hypothetical protein
MKTVELVHTCPYPGLRSFTEEESLYFKGRDLQVDQITALLEANKFLMVTGASGEGKSSIIYGGLIPNARAGFFKARYSNWVVASFRPERNPVQNMSASIAHQFNKKHEVIETELRRGFSSLVDLYANSEFYAGEDDVDQLTEAEKKEQSRKTANLLILVDQFEEFFTNPENFSNEVPSKDAQVVVNLILETARIAIRRNLPIYVICTMRSDYIGQCSAFRGLPEYIGFSQFFVPRLKRKDLKQVIEEPAILSGNSITQRLIERLVFDVADGVDQLPILQHALNQIWLIADQRNEEMDLIHYAMLGGMPSEELPEEDKKNFDEWFESLPPRRRFNREDTGLNKVIEIHANLLYENAWEYYNKDHPTNPISQYEAKRIIALTFSCLTKIDNSRAVRNRMSLAEITAIINSPKVSTDVAGAVINTYREEGNSFIYPFKTEDPATHQLSPSSVLDITHESLIRNWKRLEKWANKEFEYYSTYLDFYKQLERWKKSGKSRGYLLPIGPLTYFENWYKECKPNSNWILRYSGNGENHHLTKPAAEEILNESKAFLKQSARKEVVPRTFMKYGAQRIATVLAILIMLVLSGFYWYDAEVKKNGRVIENVRKESFGLVSSQEADEANRAIYLLIEERYRKGSLIPYLQGLEFRTRIKLAIGVYTQMLLMDKRLKSPLKTQLLDMIVKDLNENENAGDLDFFLTQTNKFLVLAAMDNYYNPDQAKQKILGTLAEKNYPRIIQFFKNRNLFRAAIPFELNMATHTWLIFGNPTQEKISELVNSISPLASAEAKLSFNQYYPKGSLEPNGRVGTDFNGGYHTLASLYAALADIKNVEWCFSQLLENNQRDYFEVPRLLNNHLNIVGYLYQFGHRDKVPQLLQWINSNTNDNPPLTILRNVALRSGYISHLYLVNYQRNYYRSIRGYIYPNLYFCDRAVFDNILEDYEKEIRKIKNVQEQNFDLSMFYKRKAMFYYKYWTDRQMPLEETKLDSWLKQAVDIYKQIDQDYLEGTTSSSTVYNGDGVRTNDVKRKNLLIYPDYRDGWFSWTFHGDYFLKYLLKNGLMADLYKSGEDLKEIHYWVAKAFEIKTDIPPSAYTLQYYLSDETLVEVINFVNQHPEGKEFDKNLLYIILSNHAFERGDSAKGMQYFHLLELQNIRNSTDRYEYLEKIFFLNMLKQLCMNLAASGNSETAIKIAEGFAANLEKTYAYLYMAERLYIQKSDPAAFALLDSAYSNLKKLDYSLFFQDFDPRFKQIMVLSEIGSKRVNQNADNILREIPEFSKFNGILARVKGVAHEGNYYRAWKAIPGTLTESQDLQCRSMILLEACREKEKSNSDTQWKNMDEYLDWFWDYVNYLPN